MSQKTSIEWTDRTWNPARGCSRVSPGCVNCYAESIAARFSKPGLAYEGLAKRVGGEARWTGDVRLIRDALADPLTWRKPQRIFVNSMSDLFHEALTDEEIARVFAVMYLAPRHTFQVLTKRAERMQRTLTSERFYRQVLDAARGLRDARPELTGVAISDPTKFPHRNVWLGVSVEDQERADERIPHLIQTPAAVRFLSCEPLLADLDLSRWLLEWNLGVDHSSKNPDHTLVPTDEDRRQPMGMDCKGCSFTTEVPLHWIIVGGESGRKARPLELSWAWSVLDQCRAAAVPCFVKQLGAKPILSAEVRERGRWVPEDRPFPLRDGKGGDPSEWPEDLRVRQFPEVRGV